MSRRFGTLRSVWTTLDGLRVHSRVSVDPAPAQSPPLVMVHGLAVSSRYMVPTAIRLAPEYRIYAPDLPGFGKSDHPPRVLGVAELTDVLVRWMDLFEIERAAMLGNSLGCQIIVDLAVRYPERISHAVLTGPTIDRCGRSMTEQASRLLVDITREPISSLLTQARDYWAAGMYTTLNTMRYALVDRIEERLPLVRVPTLVVRGSRDPITPQRWAEEITRLLPFGELAVIPRAPHAVNYTAPDELARVVRAFLYKHRHATPRPAEDTAVLDLPAKQHSDGGLLLAVTRK